MKPTLMIKMLECATIGNVFNEYLHKLPFASLYKTRVNIYKNMLEQICDIEARYIKIKLIN